MLKLFGAKRVRPEPPVEELKTALRSFPEFVLAGLKSDLENTESGASDPDAPSSIDSPQRVCSPGEDGTPLRIRAGVGESLRLALQRSVAPWQSPVKIPHPLTHRQGNLTFFGRSRRECFNFFRANLTNDRVIQRMIDDFDKHPGHEFDPKIYVDSEALFPDYSRAHETYIPKYLWGQSFKRPLIGDASCEPASDIKSRS